MKRILLIVLLFCCSCVCVLAQNRKLSKEEFRAHQEAFITENAQLTAAEAKAFFPLYFELQDKKAQQNKKAREQIGRGKDGNLSEEEYSRIVEAVVQARIATDQLDLEYLQKYKQILSARKIYQIQRAEMKFHRHLLKPEDKKK